MIEAIFKETKDKINISVFARHYENDIDKWINDNIAFISRESHVEYIEGEWYASREIALKYAQYLSPELETACLKYLAKSLEDREINSIFSVRVLINDCIY